jgi:hypothetical protein
MSFKMKSVRFDAEEAKSFALNHLRNFGGTGTPRRSDDALVREGEEMFEKAMEEIQYSMMLESSVEKKEDPSSPDVPMILSSSVLTSKGKVYEIVSPDLKDILIDIITENIGNALIPMLTAKGSFNKNRFWLLLTTKPIKISGEKGYLYITLPDLIPTGCHGPIMTAFCRSISNYLQDGGYSSIVDFLSNSGIKIPERRFCFPKAIHCPDFPKDVLTITSHKSDFDKIFAAMIGAKGKAVITGLTYFV